MDRCSLVCAALLTATLAVHAAPSRSDSLVDLAWSSWKGGSQSTVEQLFRSATEADPSNVRAHLGLALLYSLQEKAAESWKEYRVVLATGRDSYPYLFAAWITDRFKPRMDDPGSGVVELLKTLADDRNADGMIRAQACELLGGFFRTHGDLHASDAWFARMGAIGTWDVIGPFDNTSASGFDKAFPPETEFDTGKAYEGKSGVPVSWFPASVIRPDFWIDYQRFFAYTDAIYYANAFVYSGVKRPVQIRIGTSGSLKAFLNDEPLISYFDEHNNDLDTYIISTELQQGWNRLLIKCGHSEITQCNFMARITDSSGTPVEGLSVVTASRPYPHHPNAPARVIDNFAETYFKERIARDPDHIENYVLLADCYARNDKATDAELALREAMRRCPDCPLLLNSMIEAYVRGHKYDEVIQTIDKARAIDPGLPAALNQSMTRAVENEDFDEAQNILRLIEQRQPGSLLLMNSRISYFAKRKQIDKIVETNAEALKMFPDYWGFVYLQTVIDIETTKKYDAAIALVKDYLGRHYTEEALLTLSDYYFRSSQFEEWKETMAQLLLQDPCAPGYHYKAAQAFISLQQYRQAEESLRSALTICPNSSIYWSRLGDVYRAIPDTQQAIASYRSALLFNPADYDAREDLRELEGKKSIFARFTSLNVDSLRRSAPGGAAYPNDGGLVLLDDTRSAVFDRGTSMSGHELLVKMFTPSGINDFKEYRIWYNANVQQLIVERAVTIKKDGSEVKADVDNGRVVFKSLEENDCIYMKWKTKNYYRGKLSRHFWDTHSFDGFYPVRYSRYALLAADSLSIFSRVQNMPDTETRTATDDGVIREWVVRDQPSIRYEKGMPGLDDVGKVLYVSSIPSWSYIVDWFADLANAKVRSSYEVKEQVKALLAGKEGASAEEKMRLIYNFITENIRYSSVSFRQSAFIPQKARDVLVNRLGDCKDMATLCIAMLKEAGIDAHYVLVNTRDQGSNRSALPTVAFNHCIASVNTARGTRYLDLTADNYPMGSLPPGDEGAFCLDITPGGSSPSYLPKKLFSSSCIYRTATGAMHDDNSVTIRRTSLRTGASTASMRDDYRFKGAEEQLKTLSESLGQEFPNVTIGGLNFIDLDKPVDSLTTSYDMTIPHYISESGRFKFLRIPWTDNLSASEALSYEQRTYPYDYWPDVDSLSEQFSLTLPKGYIPEEPTHAASYSCPIASYNCTIRFSRGTLTGRRLFVNKKSVVAPDEYREFRKFYNAVVKEDAMQYLLRKQ